MLLTKESDYGIRIIRCLVDGGKRTVREICDVEHIPNQYAYKILKKLEHAGFVQSTRGRDGGYRLSKPLNSYSLYDVAAAVDGEFVVFECLRDVNHCEFKDEKHPCTVHSEFQRLQHILITEMRKVSVDTLLKNKA